jgi:hypothetical protein
MNHPWKELFTAPDGKSDTQRETFFLLRKRQQPWLLLPSARAAAVGSLELYPAQSLKAKLAKAALKTALCCRWYPGAERLWLPRDPTTPWEQFLQKVAGGKSCPPIASLAGNPASDGQRLIFLGFDKHHRPAWVVKVGLSGRAAALIAREESVLQALPAPLPGRPQFRAGFKHGDCRAFAMDYYAGDSAPVAGTDQVLGTFLQAWIQPEREIRLLDLPALQELAHLNCAVGQGETTPEPPTTAIIRPVIMHGDFAPWNIKVARADGRWTVLDWERGDLNGVPGWDWFHYVVQAELLVKRQPPPTVAMRLQTLLQSAPFKNYAQQTRTRGWERYLLRAYLGYIVHVIKPSEGLTEVRQLSEHFGG